MEFDSSGMFIPDEHTAEELHTAEVEIKLKEWEIDCQRDFEVVMRDGHVTRFTREQLALLLVGPFPHFLKCYRPGDQIIIRAVKKERA